MSGPTDTPAAQLVLQRGGPATPWVGQLVRVDVALWRPRTGEGELPPFSFDELDVPGAIALFSSDVPPPSERERDGTTYLVQHRTLLVFPQTDGALTLPAITARFDDVAGSRVLHVASEPLHFQAALPRGGDADSALLVASAVRLDSQIDRTLDALKVGDGFVRTLVLSATDTDPIVLPALSAEAVSGLRVYPAQTVAVAVAERGTIKASRRAAVTYVVERVGHYELPGASLRWLDPATGRYATAEVPPLSFWARPNLSLGLGAFGSAPGLELSAVLGAVLLLGTLGALIAQRLRAGPFGWEQRLRERTRERRAFASLLRASGHEPALSVLRRCYAWLAIRFPNQPRTLWPLRASSTEGARALESLERQAFAGAENNVTKPLRHGLVRARRALASPRGETSLGLHRALNQTTKDKT